MLPKNKQPERKIRYKSWEDIRNDKKQQDIYKENVDFMAAQYIKYASK